jgi:quercetin dioxygenase-like cupin family protein
VRILSGKSRAWCIRVAGWADKVEPRLRKNTEENEMKKSLFVSAVTALTIVVGLVAVAQAQKDKQVIYVSSAQATYKPSPMGGVSMAALWGEMDKGVHATFTKFDPGYDAGMHTHTSDVWIVVIKGAYLYKDEAGERRVGPGDFLRVPGGHKHWSGGDKTEGALFYEEASGKFDSTPAK